LLAELVAGLLGRVGIVKRIRLLGPAAKPWDVPEVWGLPPRSWSWWTTFADKKLVSYLQR